MTGCMEEKKKCKDNYAVKQIPQIGFVTSVPGGLQDLADKTLCNLAGLIVTLL